MSLEIDLKNKTLLEKRLIKSDYISNQKYSGLFNDGIYDIDIVKVEKFENNGISVFAKATKNGKQIGFGDGSVEIERFIIINPPVLVPDVNGDIIRKKDDNTEYRLREDPLEALRKTLSHTISLVGKEGTNVTRGKVGRSTLTVYPDADTESTSVDGSVGRQGIDETWSTIHDSASGTASQDSGTSALMAVVGCSTTTNQFDFLRRSIFLFDTSTLGSGATISAAVLSLFGDSGGGNGLAGGSYNIYSSNPASNTAIGTADYNTFGTTGFSTAKLQTAWSTSAYNDYTLNASGLSAISKTGISKFALREATWDAPNSAPTWSSGQSNTVAGFYADQTGTTNDPKLVITYTAAVVSSQPMTLTGVA